MVEGQERRKLIFTDSCFRAQCLLKKSASGTYLYNLSFMAINGFSCVTEVSGKVYFHRRYQTIVKIREVYLWVSKNTVTHLRFDN